MVEAGKAIGDMVTASRELDYVLNIDVHNCNKLYDKFRTVRTVLNNAREAGINSCCDSPYEDEPDGCVGIACTMRIAASRYREAESLLVKLENQLNESSSI
jgi:hypothetical protein